LRRITVRQSRCSVSGTKLKRQLLGDQALHQPLGIRKVFLTTTGASIRLRLGEVQRPREATRVRSFPTLRPPVLFQRFPDRPPILRGRLHDDFLDPVLDQPVGQAAQIGRCRSDLLALEVEIAIDLDVGHHHRQHLLVDVNSRDSVRHRSLLGRAESVPRRINQGRGLSSVPCGTRRRPMIRSITHAPDQTGARPRRLHWLTSISPLSALL
jgi:hypothetical protein